MYEDSQIYKKIKNELSEKTLNVIRKIKDGKTFDQI